MNKPQEIAAFLDGYITFRGAVLGMNHFLSIQHPIRHLHLGRPLSSSPLSLPGAPSIAPCSSAVGSEPCKVM